VTRECPVIGHSSVRERLQDELPPQPLLLLGPESVGKWMLAKWAAAQHASWYNSWIAERPSIDFIRRLRVFLESPPAMPADQREGQLLVKVAAVNLDGIKVRTVQNALLKELEEPPDYARFILTSSSVPLPTIASRCISWHLPRLTDAEVAQVLVLRGASQKDAQLIAPAVHGQVAPALAIAERFRPAKVAMLGVVRAIAARDADLLDRAVRGWGETEDWMLRELLGACASGAPTSLFSSTERQVLGSSAARRTLALLDASGRARPQVTIRALAAVLMAEGKY
jgi:DNA polymerase III delta subunit-like protein